jgi:hypothetical protein
MTRRSLVLLTTFSAAWSVSIAGQVPKPVDIRGPVTTAETAHLRVNAAVSVAAVAPGTQLALVVDVTPLRNIHVYAPGKHTYQVVNVEVAPRPWLRVKATSYPPSTIYHFKPLDERVAVYSNPFQLVRELTIPTTPEVRKALAGRTTVILDATLAYQACDDKICYSPQKVPMSWTLAIKTNGSQ